MLNCRSDLDHSQAGLLVPLWVAVSLDHLSFIVKARHTDFDEGIGKVSAFGER